MLTRLRSSVFACVDYYLCGSPFVRIGNIRFMSWSLGAEGRRFERVFEMGR